MCPWWCSPLLAPGLLLLLLLLPHALLATTTTAEVVEQGQSAVFQQRVEVLVEGEAAFTGTALVEASRSNADTLIILTSTDPEDAAPSLVSGRGSGRAVVVKSVGGRVTSLLHHQDETAASLNYKRALASLLTPAHHTHGFAYHTQADVLGTCEVHYEQEGLRTLTWRDLTRCSHFSWEQVLGGHHLPVLHLALDLMNSSSRCEYRWVGEAGSTLEDVHCTETLMVAPRYTRASQVLNISLITSLTHNYTSDFNPAAFDYLQEATETTALTYQTLPYDEEAEDVDVSELLKEVCSIEGEGRLTGGLLQKMSQVIHALARTSTELPPDLTNTCPINVRRMVALASAVVGGPRTLHFFVSQVAELSRDPEAPIQLGDDYLFTLALHSLVRPDHHTRHRLPHNFFDRRENQMVYEELVDFLLEQTPPAVAGVAAMLEGLKEVSPQLFMRLLEKSGPYLSPEAACIHGDHAEAVRLLRGVSGLSVRPEGYVASLRPCFQNDIEDVMVAAMDTLATADCDVEGATELQKLGLDSTSDPEIRIAAYRSLVHCIPLRPHLLETVAKALDPKDDAFSTQVASYVWSHVQSVVSSDDPSMMTLRELLAAAEGVSKVPDPVWYDPRQHSRHLSQTVHMDARTALTLSADLVWGRYSPAPRALYLNLALHHDGATHQLAQVVVRLTGLEAMLFSIPGMENLLTTSTSVAAQLWWSVSRLAHGSARNEREITQEQVAEFIEQVLTRIPAGYRAGSSSLEVSLRLLGTHAFHVRLADLRYASPLDTLIRHLQPPLQAAFLALAPLLDNTLTMATSSGVPVALELSGVGGFQALAKHYLRDDVGILNFVASGGVSVWTRVAVGQGRPPALVSQVLWSMDVPVTATYEYEEAKTRVSFRVPDDWTGRLLQLRRDTSLTGNTLQLRVTQDCMGSGGPMELCLDTWSRDETREGAVGGPGGWLAPYAHSLNLQRSFSGEPVITVASTPNAGEAQVTQVVVEAGDRIYEGNLATQLLPSPSFAITLNSPEHTYFLKGFAGSRESITQVAGFELGLDRSRYGLRLQLSTLQLEHQRVWSPSAFLTMPDRGEEEVIKLFLSLKDEDNGFSTEFSFGTFGVAANYMELRVEGEVGGGVSSEDGSLRMLEVRSLRVTWPGRVDVDFIGQIYLTRTPQGQGSIKVGWGKEEGEVQVGVALGPVVTFVPGPQHDPGGAGGTFFKFAFSAFHNNTFGLSEGSLSLLLDSGRVDVSLGMGLSESGGFKISHTYNGPLDFKTSASVFYVPLEVAWGAEHELVVREEEVRHGLNVSWSARPQDRVSTLLHYVNDSDIHLDVSLKALLVYPGQLVEVEQTVAEAQGGTYKSKLMVRLDPGRTLHMDTIFITRSDEGVISYGMSNTVRLDSWITPLSMVGTVNCLGLGQCSVAVTADIAGDVLMDVELQHTAAGGVSRTDAKIIITDWVDGRVSLDTAYKIGYYDLKWRASVWAWARLVQGRAEVDLADTDVAATEMVIQELLQDDQLGALTHVYNGTVNLNRETRTLNVRQEVRVNQEGGNQLWAAVVQGRAGYTILNSRHFAKATLMTPTGMYYTASGDVSSEVSGPKTVMAAVSLSAGAGPNTTYLLAWDLDFNQPYMDPNWTAVTVGEAVEGEPLLLSLETLLRANTPTTGEVKLNIKIKKTLHTSLDGEDDAATISEKTNADIRLITESVPELGRVHGSLTKSEDTYSLNGRMWSGQRSVGVMSYGVARNDSLKSSHSVVLVDPIMPRGMLEVAMQTDHVGSFPYNFQSSASGKVIVGLEEAGQVRGLLEWTPSTAAISLALNTFFEKFPGGNFYFKWSPGALVGQMAWEEVKGVAAVQWQEGGRSLELTLNLDNPGATLHDLDVSLTYSLSQMPYPPVALALAAMVSVNTLHHFVLNVDCRSQEEHYLVTGAMARPDSSGSLRLQLRRGGDTYGGIGAIVFNGFSLQLTGAFTAVEAGEDLLATLHSSLVPDPLGYTFRLTRKTGPKNVEITFFFSQGGSSPEWIYGYRLLAQLERDIKQRVRRLAAEDRFTFRILDQLIFEYNFLAMIVHNNFDETELEVKFPDLWPEVKMTGTLLKGKDSQLDLDITTPSLTHVVEGRIIFSSNDWWSAHSASLEYSQQDKGGRASPFKLEMEASRWNTDRQKYKFFVQKTHTEVPSTIGTLDVDYEYPLEMYDFPEYQHDEPERLPSFTTFDATLDVSRETGSTEYKLAWQTDETKNEAKVLLEKDPSGGGALLRYHRHVKGVPKSEIEYQLKGNYRRIDTEVTISCTLDQTSIGRPRGIIFLHSEAEGYTELFLDLFQDEADQVMLVIICLPSKFSFRIGEYTNTFLLMGYQTVTDDDGATLHKVEVGSFGRNLEVWVGRLEEGRTCTKGGLVLETPSLAPTHHLIMFCPDPAPELTIQVLGVEKYEGPYLRVGQISGPGGVGLQVGSGRLRPLDTPPAHTLTADVENEVLEILLDWQSPSLAQLKEELISRGTAVAAAVQGLGSTVMSVDGVLGLWPLLEDTQTLLQEATDLAASTSKQMFLAMVDEGSLDIGNLLNVSGQTLKEHVETLVELCVTAVEDVLDGVQGSTEDAMTVVDGFVQEMAEDITYAYDTVEGQVREVVDRTAGALRQTLRPPFLRVHAAINAITYNDDQSLYALVSRVMGEVRTRLGRRTGLSGFLQSQLLTRIERMLVTGARWDELRAWGTNLLQYVRKITIFSVVMPHRTALKFRMATPRRLGRDVREAGRWLVEEEGPRLLAEARACFRSHWSRLQYLLTWHAYGEAVVFGWDQAITWDGRQVTPLLTDSCHHLLVMLTHARTPTAVTIHMEDLSTRPREVFTFFSGTDTITLDLDLKMTYNSKQIRRPLLEVGELSLRLSRERASVTSAAGLTLECEIENAFCRLTVSGENFAATAGLLGVFDFDNNTDFMTSGWEMPPTEEEWAQSWRLASSDQCSSHLPESHIPAPQGQHCTILFHTPQSPFKSCFKSVSPSPYLETCRAGWECAAEAAYLHACHRHYHTLAPNLTSCTMCTVEGLEEEGTEGLMWEVVIITDFECFVDLQDFISALVKDHSGNHRIVVRYIGRGSPRAGPFEDVDETVVDNGTPPLDAALNAANLDFSARALKSIVLFDCDHPRCSVSSSAPKIVKLRETLLSQGVQLHVITMDAITVLDRQSLSRRDIRQLIGMDGRTTFLVAHARKRKVKGKRSIRNYITTPIGNTCTHLAIESDGSVFSLQNIRLDRRYHRRIFQQLLALRVEEGREAEYLSCRRCECHAPCTLCNPPSPLVYSSWDRDDEEEDEDYD